MELGEKNLEPRLWHACAGGTVQMPLVNSKVFYFPQGHAEHSESKVDFGPLPRMNAKILCRVAGVKFLADLETDEVYARMSLVPVDNNEHYDLAEGGIENDRNIYADKTAIATFSKTLTQSDANNGGGFSVPRFCAETMFPPLNYTADPPVQNVTARDLLGETWQFRHIFRGTPRRHLLTTGWSAFVNQKKLVAGDSIVFLRPDEGELGVGIRRAKKCRYAGPESPSGWNTTSQGSYGGLSAFLREEESQLMRNGGNKSMSDSSGSLRDKGRVRPESVIEAASLAGRGQPFEIVYYPRSNTQEFCVKASSVTTSLMVPWSHGMRFKMAFDTEDSSRTTWSNGTIVSYDVMDPFHWPGSPWGALQVSWDEPDLLQNVKCVSPWNVELVSNMPVIHFSPFLPPRKRLCVVQQSDISLDCQLPLPSFSSSPFGPNGHVGPSSLFSCLPDNITSGIQGARHPQYGVLVTDLHPHNTLQLGLLSTNYHQQVNADVTNGIHRDGTDNIPCLVTNGNSSKKEENSENSPTPLFVLFGQPILTEQQMFNGSSTDRISQTPKEQNFDLEEKLMQQSRRIADIGLEISQCKVFLDSTDTGWSLDLSVLSSYEELYERLSSKFEIEISNLVGKVLYHDAVGAVKNTGDEPFSVFKKMAEKLTIMTKSGSNSKRTLITICLQQQDD